MESFEANIFSKGMMEMHQNQTDHSQFQEEDISKILEKMKLSNQNGADLFQVKEDYCNIIVNELLGQLIRDSILIRRIKNNIFYVNK